MSLVLLIIFALWTGFWSFLSRLVVHSFRFMTTSRNIEHCFHRFPYTFTAEEYLEFLFRAGAARVAVRRICRDFFIAALQSLICDVRVISRSAYSRPVLISAGIVSVLF
jgi:hypothetical protein